MWTARPPEWNFYEDVTTLRFQGIVQGKHCLQNSPLMWWVCRWKESRKQNESYIGTQRYSRSLGGGFHPYLGKWSNLTIHFSDGLVQPPTWYCWGGRNPAITSWCGECPIFSVQKSRTKPSFRTVSGRGATPKNMLHTVCVFLLHPRGQLLPVFFRLFVLFLERTEMHIP